LTIETISCSPVVRHCCLFAVQYKLKQDPSLLHSIEFQHSGPALIALSPDGLVAAIASSASISIYCTSDGSLATQLDSVHTGWLCALVLRIAKCDCGECVL
jgi:hypothetical protein